MSLEEFRIQRERSKRASIILGARKLFSQNGFHEVTTVALAAEGGVSTATLYRYFDDKETLFNAVIDEFVDQISTALDASAQRNEDRLGALCVAYANLFSNPEFIGLLRVIIADAGESAGFGAKLEEQGHALFFSAIDAEVRGLLGGQPSEETIAQASSELCAVIEHHTLVPHLLFCESTDAHEVKAMVERTLANWRRHWRVTW